MITHNKRKQEHLVFASAIVYVGRSHVTFQSKAITKEKKNEVKRKMITHNDKKQEQSKT